jgi:hypothetical protein
VKFFAVFESSWLGVKLLRMDHAARHADGEGYEEKESGDSEYSQTV